MSKRIFYFVGMSMIIVLLPTFAITQSYPEFNGKWILIPEKSSEIGLYGTLSINIQQTDTSVTIIQKWGTSRSFSDTLNLKTNGQFQKVPIKDRVFPTNVFMGLSMPVGKFRQVKTMWENNGSILKIEQKYNIRGSQGNTLIHSIHICELSPDKEILIHKIERSTRKSGPDVKYVLKREGNKNAYFMKLENNWEVKDGLDKQAFLISLQGVANTGGPNLYFIYPENWPFTYTASVFDYYKNIRTYTFSELKTPEQALETFKEYIKRYVVWDKSVRTSLIVAFTVAGLERAVIVSEEMIPMVENAGLKIVEDFGIFHIGLKVVNTF